MSSVMDGIPMEFRDILVGVLRMADRQLLDELNSCDIPTQDQRFRVMDLLTGEFCRNLRPDSEPTERGVLIDNALGAFLLLWPIENDG